MKLAISLGFLWLFTTATAVANSEDADWQERSEWSAVFRDEGVTGTALVFDEASDQWLVHDRQRASVAYSPASTFKIFNAMAALDSGVVADEYEVIRWDGKKRSMPVWNRDHSLASGMKFSVVWFYQDIARRIGPTRMQRFVDAVGYGNRDLHGPIDAFWLNNTVRISARQQVDFLRQLADGTLPFSPRAQEAVRRMTIIEHAPGWILHAKTGWAVKDSVEGQADLGWIVGWLERSGRRWFFAVNFDMPTSEFAGKRLPLAKKLLTDIGALDR